MAAVFVDELPSDGLLHDLLHLEGRGSWWGALPPTVWLADTKPPGPAWAVWDRLIPVFLLLPFHQVLCRPTACGLREATLHIFLHYSFRLRMTRFFSGVTQNGISPPPIMLSKAALPRLPPSTRHSLPFIGYLHIPVLRVSLLPVSPF